MTAKINSINVQIGDQEIVLTFEEAKKLYHELEKLFGKNLQLPYYPPRSPQRDEPYIWFTYNDERT